MTEDQSFPPTGYNIDSALARQEVYRLLCYIYASKHIADLDKPLLNLLCCDFEETEVTRTLINTAIIVRLFLDSKGPDASSNTESAAGELTPDVNAPQKIKVDPEIQTVV